MDNIPQVYAAISKVTAMMATEGISKSRKNQQQGYSFRGIDEVYNALSRVLADNQLCMLPRILSRECVERQTKSGGALFYTIVEAEFDLVSAVDGSKHIIRTFGEAMDSADKSTNKAMSAAYKYAAMQAFCIPTEGDNDADAVTHEVSSKPAEKISEAQAAELAHLSELTSTNIPAMCDFYKVSDISELPIGKFAHAKATLEKRIKDAS